MLCPVQVIKGRLAKAGDEETLLFGHHCALVNHRVPLTEDVLLRFLKSIHRVDQEVGLTGHSFWVGGASLRYALGVPVAEICELGSRT
ncbi:hypothetical protein PSHT_01464 [Puccinia striiformis]|uniref:Uncharacterized protein n=2 Tax=Puccinia striiformis TaxID=27350 RepID=A0A0L0VC02_9BASI|nr:hypothetical protein PSTG_10007 [Puccinia striiformis f. sp. tritici PST-78]POW22305.1 hypothetical protein PSHT_01464 [Puccinia striiformis]